MKIAQTKIRLQEVKFYAHHGVSEQETLVGNHFMINLELTVDFIAATKSDKVEDTVSYADVYDVLKEQMNVPSKLLEHVSGRITNALYAVFPKVQGIMLEVIKCTPPIGADTKGASVVLVSTRD
ncbi:MAG: dihydroneopterin aldolase [Bacteroidaceae bacterium]